MKLVVALGNASKEYSNTRHNVGFMVADFMFSDFVLEKKFLAYVHEGSINGNRFMMIKPITMMNLSGDSVSLVCNYYKIKPEDVLVIQDDMDLSLGVYRLKRNSSAGGHNGIKSIISSLKSDAFLRLKVGIGRGDDAISFVLGSFAKSELTILSKNFDVYKQIVECFIANGVDKTLAMYSKRSL